MKKITSPIKEIKDNGKTIVHEDGSVAKYTTENHTFGSCKQCCYDPISCSIPISCIGAHFTSSHNQPELSIKIKYTNTSNIADAGTTANKCGLLPSELLEQRDEIFEALQKMCEYHEKMATWDKGDNGYYLAKQLIKKIESTK